MSRLGKNLLFGALLLVVSGIANAGDLDPFAGQKEVLKIAGGTAHIPVMKDAAEIIMRNNPEIRITIAGGVVAQRTDFVA